MNSAVKASIVVALLSAGFLAFKNFAAKLTVARKVVHRGKFARVEYTTKHSTMPTYQAGSLTSAQIVADASIVHMENGTSVLINEKIDVLFSPGTEVRVEEDGFGRRFLVADVEYVNDRPAEAV